MVYEWHGYSWVSWGFLKSYHIFEMFQSVLVRGIIRLSHKTEGEETKIQVKLHIGIIHIF